MKTLLLLFIASAAHAGTQISQQDLVVPAMGNGGLMIGGGVKGVSTGTITGTNILVTNGNGSISLGVDSSSVTVKNGGIIRNSEIDSSSVTKYGILVPVTGGGTGAITAATARTNLGAAASGANADIYSMAGNVGNPGLTVTTNTVITSTLTVLGLDSNDVGIVSSGSVVSQGGHGFCWGSTSNCQTGPAAASSVGGSGTTNYDAKFTAAATVGSGNFWETSTGTTHNLPMKFTGGVSGDMNVVISSNATSFGSGNTTSTTFVNLPVVATGTITTGATQIRCDYQAAVVPNAITYDCCIAVDIDGYYSSSQIPGNIAGDSCVTANGLTGNYVLLTGTATKTVTAGPHTFSLWYRVTSAGTCNYNPGYAVAMVICTEIK